MPFRITSRLLFSENGQSESEESGWRSSRDQCRNEDGDCEDYVEADDAHGNDQAGEPETMETHL